jgi:hypothetical protein
MKKVLAVMVVMLMAAPALGDVDITCSDEGGGVASIKYDATTEGQLVRAFALDITVSAGTIDGIGGYPTDGTGYGIYPGSIVISGGVVTDYGNPVAPASDPGALGGIGTNGITIEMGSLYEAGVDPAPPASGTLCTISVTEACTVTIAENGTRGGVVLEDATNPTTVTCTPCGNAGPGCFDPAHPDYNEWQAVGEPECWCYKYQCEGDADGKKLGGKAGYFRVEYADLGILINSWKTKTDGAALGDYTGGGGICADFDRKELGGKAGYFRVEYADLGILINHWKKSDAELDDNCGGDIIVWEP